MLGTALLILLGTAELLPRTVLPLLLMLVLMQGKYCAAGARCRAETASNGRFNALAVLLRLHLRQGTVLR